MPTTGKLNLLRPPGAPELRLGSPNRRNPGELQRVELDRQRIAGLYKALSQANRVIVRATEEIGLYHQVCQVCAEFLHLELVFVSRADPAGTHLEAVTSSGHKGGYLDGLSIALDPASLDPSGRCLAGMGEQICQDWSLNLGLSTWRDRAKAFGLRSSASFPLTCEERVVSVLNLYSAEAGFFTPDRLDLLREIAGDASFALERFAREAHRQEAEEAFRATFEQAAVGITHISQEGILLKVNKRYAEMTGYAEADLVGRRELDLTAPEDRAEDARETEALVLGLRPSSCWAKRYLHQDGQPIWTRVTLSLLHDLMGAPTFFVNVVEDLTSEKAAEAERQELTENLNQAQKMESLGTLAAGIAHDMNNVLAAILGTAEIIQTGSAAEEDLARYLGTIIRACERGRDLVKNLTAFARKDLQKARLLDLNQLVQEEMALLSRTTLRRVEVRSDLAADLPPILGEPSAISSALMNLCVNAVNAMPFGGILTLRTVHAPGLGVQVVVTDNGEGMAKEVLAKAVEPFFTTQPVGKGTGLGLTIAFAVLKAHGGTLDIVSEPGQGTTVTLGFPAAAGVEAPPAAVPVPGLQAPARVLVVDDDELLLEVIPQLLSVLGHSAAIAHSGQEALDLLAEGLSADLVLLDQNMPGLSGTQTLSRIRERWPLLPVIMGTGYMDAGAVVQAEADPLVRILHKPYTGHEVRLAIAQLRPDRP